MGGRLGTPVCSAADGKQGDSDYLDEKLADIIKVQHATIHEQASCLRPHA